MSREQFWTEDRKALVAKMWKEGFSARVIAGAVGDGCTRNAAIGLISRLKLQRGHKATPPGGKPLRAPRKRLPGRAIRPVDVTPFLPIAIERADLGQRIRSADVFSPAGAPEGARVVPLEQLREGQCKWPLFDTEKPWLFCGGPAERNAEGKALPYCRFHGRRAVSR